MIHKKVIDAIYKKFKSRPASPDELDIPLLFEKLVIGSIDQGSLLHSIPVSHIHAIIDFDEAVAVVLHSSIIFLSKEDGSAHVHVKDISAGLFDRLKSAISRQAVL